MGKKHLDLFGGDKSWKSDEWTSSDDRVRGGKSQSYLDCATSTARFHGHLDIKTLGGAGFASQRTTGEDWTLDLSAYDGINIEIEKSDSKRYTFILKDTLLPKSPNGREQSTISYEYDFQLSSSSSASNSSIFIPWKNLSPTYRGKEKKDAASINLKSVKRISIMMRSFFGDQEGDFSLTIKSIAAVSSSSKASAASLDQAEKGTMGLASAPRQPFLPFRNGVLLMCCLMFWFYVAGSLLSKLFDY